MADVTVTIRGGRELEQALRRLNSELQGRIVAEALQDGAKILEGEAKMRAPKKRGEGNRKSLAARITTLLQAGPRSIHAFVMSRAPHSHLIEFGTRQHVIKPKQKEALTPRKGDFAAKVKHPGGRSHPFMRPAWDYSQQRVVNAIADGIRRRVEAAKNKIGAKP